MDIRMKIIERLAKIKRKVKTVFLHWGGYKHIDSQAIIESNVKLDKLNPAGIHIGKNTLVASGTCILSHEHIFVKPDGSYYMKDTFIGKNCFIGIRSLICPGVHIGDQCVIGAGSVVTKDIPSNSMAVGVPAKVIKNDIRMNDHARLEGEIKFKE